MSNYGSWKIINGLLTFTVNTHDPSTGAQTDADSPPTYRVYEDETGTPILTGTMAKLDDANTVGFYSEQIELDASAPGFEKTKSYIIRVEATVGGVTGALPIPFQIEAQVDITSVAGAAVTGVADFKADVTGEFDIGSVKGVGVTDVDDFKADVSGLGSINIVPLTAVVNATFQPGQQIEVVTGNKGLLATVALEGDWTSYSFRLSAKDEPDSSAFAIGPDDVAGGDVTLGTDADGNTITTVGLRFAEGDLDIVAAVYTAELTADTGDSSGADLVTTIQFPLKVIEGLIG